MSWPCYMAEPHPEHPTLFRLQDGDTVLFSMLKPGAMWFDHGELAVKLPSKTEWNIDRGRIINERLAAAGKTERMPQWTRTGEAPNVTASPSINHQGYYHGWLVDGILSDDCEGRTFPEAAA